MNKSVLTAILLATLLATSWGQDDQERIDTARVAFKKLEARAEKLPTPPKLNPREVPTPPPHLMQLAQDIYRFAKANNDLDLAPGADLLRAEVCAAMGDPARAISAADRAQNHEKSYAFHKVKALYLKSTWRTKYGDFQGAIKDLESLLKDFPQNQAKSGWQKQLSDVKKQEARQKKDREKLAQGNAAGVTPRSQGRALRFAAAFPLAEFSKVTLQTTLNAMGDAPATQLCAPAERLAFYFPAAKGWAKAAGIVVNVFAQEGEYEKALFYAQCLLNRSELLKGSPAAQLGKLSGNLKAKLAQIYARPLDVEPKTKKNRLAHFFRFAKPYEDQDAVAQMAEDIKADYPTMSESAKVAWILANATSAELPERSLALYREIAEQYSNSQWGYPSLEKVLVNLENQDGPEAAESWLTSIREKFKQDAKRTQIDLARADLLDKLDRWEEAKKVLLPWVAKSFGATKEELSRRIADYDKKIGN